MFAEDAVAVDNGVGEARARDAIRARVAAMLAAFPDLRLERKLLLVDEACNADEWLLTGTHRGEYLGIAPSGRRLEVHGATFSRFGHDGLVVHDVAGLLNQRPPAEPMAAACPLPTPAAAGPAPVRPQNAYSSAK